MYRCHLCSLETKQLNGLLTKHWKKHCNNLYSKDLYKVDVLKFNGRHQPICKYCDKPTFIPKGEKEYPIYHKACYLANVSGESNPNYSGGKTTTQCKLCAKQIIKHESQFIGKNRFCSISCSMQFYAIDENRTVSQIHNDNMGKVLLQKLKDTDKYKINQAKALAKMQQDKKSNVETKVFNLIKQEYLNATDQKTIDFYIFDIFIPETNSLIEVNGNYWHNSPEVRDRDNRKHAFIKNKYKDIKLFTIWESEIKDLPDNNIVGHIFKPIEIYILCGPSGCGKTHISNELSDYFNVIDYDIFGFNGAIEKCKIHTDKPKLLVTAYQAKRIARMLRNLDIRVSCVYLRENQDTIAHRLSLRNSSIKDTIISRIKRYESLKDKIFNFYGTQSEVRDWLLKQRLS